MICRGVSKEVGKCDSTESEINFNAVPPLSHGYLRRKQLNNPSSRLHRLLFLLF